MRWRDAETDTTRIDDLNDYESELVRQCLLAAADGPFFDDWEFKALIGLDWGKVRRLAQHWPAVNLHSHGLSNVAVNALHNLLGYPHGHEADVARFVGAGTGEVESIMTKLS